MIFGSYNNFEKTLEEMRDQISNNWEIKMSLWNGQLYLCHLICLILFKNWTGLTLELSWFYEKT